MPRPRTGDKERALIEAAIELFLEKGFRRTTVQDIARRAGVAVGTVYVYYKDKVAVVRRVAHAFAERHAEFADRILNSRKQSLKKLDDYVLGFYDMWQPFADNKQGPRELAGAVLEFAPETRETAEQRFLRTIEDILAEGKAEGLRIERPGEEARWIALSTAAFFPLAGTPAEHPLGIARSRENLQGLLRWIGRKLKR